MTRASNIISIAKSYVGKLEKPGNAGFFDPAFEKELTTAGWYKGAPWCAFFTKLVWKKAYADSKTLQNTINRICSGGALMTLNNHKNNGTFKVSLKPIPGSIAIWRHGNTTRGHAAIVVAVVDANTFRTIEGNTNASGSREGDRVAEKLRTLNRPFKADGLNLVGFVNPAE